MKPLVKERHQKKCKRCNKHLAHDIICPACKNDLIAMYDNKLGWKTAYEVEKISMMAFRGSYREVDDFD